MFVWHFDEMRHKTTYQEPSTEDGEIPVLSLLLQAVALAAVMFSLVRLVCGNEQEQLHCPLRMILLSNLGALSVQDCSICHPMEYITYAETDLYKLKMMQAQWFSQIHVLFPFSSPLICTSSCLTTI